jgi:hypothetical protein
VKLRYDALLESKERKSFPLPKLTPQEREVYDAVSTLWQAGGKRCMTYAMIYRGHDRRQILKAKVPKRLIAHKLKPLSITATVVSTSELWQTKRGEAREPQKRVQRS